MAPKSKEKKQRPQTSVPCEVFFACTLCGSRSRTVPKLYQHYRLMHKGELHLNESPKLKAKDADNDSVIEQTGGDSPKAKFQDGDHGNQTDANGTHSLKNSEEENGKQKRRSSDDEEGEGQSSDGRKIAIRVMTRGEIKKLKKDQEDKEQREKYEKKRMTRGLSKKMKDEGEESVGKKYVRLSSTVTKTDMNARGKPLGENPVRLSSTVNKTDMNARGKPLGEKPVESPDGRMARGGGKNLPDVERRKDSSSSMQKLASVADSSSKPKEAGNNMDGANESVGKDCVVTRKKNIPLGMLEGKKNSLMVIFQHADQTKPLPEGSSFKLRNAGGEQTYMVVANVDVDIIEHGKLS